MTIFFSAEIHTRKRIAARLCRTLRRTGLAQVHCCHPLSDYNPVSYCIGAEYVEPYP